MYSERHVSFLAREADLTFLTTVAIKLKYGRVVDLDIDVSDELFEHVLEDDLMLEFIARLR